MLRKNSLLTLTLGMLLSSCGEYSILLKNSTPNKKQPKTYESVEENPVEKSDIVVGPQEGKDEKDDEMAIRIPISKELPLRQVSKDIHNEKPSLEDSVRESIIQMSKNIKIYIDCSKAHGIPNTDQNSVEASNETETLEDEIPNEEDFDSLPPYLGAFEAVLVGYEGSQFVKKQVSRVPLHCFPEAISLRVSDIPSKAEFQLQARLFGIGFELAGQTEILTIETAKTATLDLYLAKEIVNNEIAIPVVIHDNDLESDNENIPPLSIAKPLLGCSNSVSWVFHPETLSVKAAYNSCMLDALEEEGYISFDEAMEIMKKESAKVTLCLPKTGTLYHIKTPHKVTYANSCEKEVFVKYDFVEQSVDGYTNTQ